MDKVLQIVYSSSSMLDKLVSIARHLEGENLDLGKLAQALSVPESVLIVDRINAPKVYINPVNSFKLYVNAFGDAYLKIHKSKYRFSGMDRGQLKYIQKTVKVDEFKQMMDYLVNRHVNKNVKKIDFDIMVILNNLTPAKIYRNINLLMRESSKASTLSGWGFGIGQKGVKP